MKKVLLAAVLMGITLTACNENKQTTNEDMNTTLQLTQEWDKVFRQGDSREGDVQEPLRHRTRSRFV